MARIAYSWLVLERASARPPCAVAVGAICRAYLAQFGITVGGYATSIGEVDARIPDDLSDAVAFHPGGGQSSAAPDPDAAEAMRKTIWDTMQAKDTLGGVFEIVATGVPAGLGSHVHFDRKIDGQLAAVSMSIQAIKGVEIGPAFANVRLRGTQVHDDIVLEDSGAEPVEAPSALRSRSTQGTGSAGFCIAPPTAPAGSRAASPPASRSCCARR